MPRLLHDVSAPARAAVGQVLAAGGVSGTRMRQTMSHLREAEEIYTTLGGLGPLEMARSDGNAKVAIAGLVDHGILTTDDDLDPGNGSWVFTGRVRLSERHATALLVSERLVTKWVYARMESEPVELGSGYLAALIPHITYSKTPPPGASRRSDAAVLLDDHGEHAVAVDATGAFYTALALRFDPDSRTKQWQLLRAARQLTRKTEPGSRSAALRMLRTMTASEATARDLVRTVTAVLS